ncbi:NAD(P)H-binding protein [Cellulophaga sp. HaHa_2_95]|uniref:NAD(P)H-binding protein n=1 Tax=Cellulophaga sp. HaHa_2_95 TaxID=2745558 RepID=UPI001C4FDCAB|nr:NAD(P)H-binding protein [Cellulophaga sp. HaHa_2_95]QXP56300.1 NAD(P)H-binding protein [Cellulophaga sp. HaHa_2_95]
MNKTIGILGCGWLGLPLAKSLIASNYPVKGSTTSEAKLIHLTELGIEASKIVLSEKGIIGSIDGFLTKIETLIINVPPKLRGTNKENFVAKMEHLLQKIEASAVEHIIFVSSTAVYGEVDGVVTEQTIPAPATESGIQLLASEDIFKNHSSFKTTIIRFGGLVSEDRHPVTMLVKKEGLKNGEMPVNLIHRDDCIRIIKKVIEENWSSVIINGVYPEHPTKKEYYSEVALQRGLNMPDYEADKTKKGKIISADYLLNVKNFKFLTSLKK